MDIDDKDINIHCEVNPITPDRSMLERLRQKPTISDIRRNKLDIEAKLNWDRFYRSHGARFFKPRQWIIQEFEELAILNDQSGTRFLLEIGCGCGDFALTLLDKTSSKSKGRLYVYCCDFSSKAIEVLKSRDQYISHESNIRAFVANAVNLNEMQLNLDGHLMHLITLVFVLSAIHPRDMKTVLTNVYKLLDGCGVVLFRDYGLYDATMLRFSNDHKIDDNLYFRGDGTRAYFFTLDEVTSLFSEAGFQIIESCYVRRNTVNVKEGLCTPRVFVQLRCTKLN
ncbi:tRNA N(3)-methylcytidine methyltransferase METTL6, partial [Fragariocoptes setiger]